MSEIWPMLAVAATAFILGTVSLRRRTD